MKIIVSHRGWKIYVLTYVIVNAHSLQFTGVLMTGYAGNFDDVENPSNLVGAAIISTAGAVVAQDWPGATSAGISGSTASRLVIIHSNVALAVNMFSTGAAFPTTNSAGTTATSGLNFLQSIDDQHVYRIPSSSTGYSLTAATSGVATISFWQEV